MAEAFIPPADVGVIVGRFQVPDLHKAHVDIIGSVCEKHHKVIIILGVAPVFSSSNPLDIEAREQMIKSIFPSVIVTFIKDHPSDNNWSNNLDGIITSLLGPKQTARLYGGRDSFIKHYSGKFPTTELVSKEWISGSEIRDALKNTVHSSKEFRHGVIWASWQRFDTVYSTVDIAILSEDSKKVILGRKANSPLWRFPGGFVDPTDESIEDAANREVREEIPSVDFEIITPAHYVASVKINDWRYRTSLDKVMTHFYATTYCFGNVCGGDDLVEAEWHNISDITADIMNPEHHKLFALLKSKLKGKKSK